VEVKKKSAAKARVQKSPSKSRSISIPKKGKEEEVRGRSPAKSPIGRNQEAKS
jgi:hypothetical protein